MTGASFILATNLLIAALFALAFFIVAVTNRSDRVAGWFCLAYLFGLAYIFSEFIQPSQGDPRVGFTLGFAAFHGALAAVTVGVATRYRRPVPWPLILGSAVIGMAANWYGYGLGRESMFRHFAYQSPYAFLQLLAAFLVLRSGRRQPMDIGLMALFVLSAVQFLSKPLVAALTDGAGSSTYLATVYALYSQSLGAVLQVATGLLMLMLLVRDMLVEVTERSETDPLSGLLNRRGFEEHAQAMLAAAAPTSSRVAFIASDLDNFKSINDGFGHDAGDQVIVAFAALLKSNKPPKALVCRLGGEEFAILLPGTPLSAARVYAEGLRAAFAALPVAALPPQRRCTASFGVAEYDGGETLSDLRRRADAALYVSKRDGRDRVSVSGDPNADSMPLHPLQGTMALQQRG